MLLAFGGLFCLFASLSSARHNEYRRQLRDHSENRETQRDLVSRICRSASFGAILVKYTP
jgi:hypothetical protein